ncbi:MAG: DsbA family protein [Desulfobacterales bacterium]|jgi:predicted DsbA family dithiol-disulfide isomerase
MVEIKDRVDFYWDPICPWCWITSRWMVDVGRQKQIRVNWKLFSLKIINKDRDIPEHFKILHQIGLRALRVAAAVGKEYGNDGLAKLYTVMGTRYHHDNEDIDEPDILEEILKSCGFPEQLAAAVDEEAWDKIIAADMGQAVAKVGTDVGVPLIVLDGGKGPGFFGPVFSPAPTGNPAAALWDAIIVAGRTPGFFELKRTRETGPLFGERPEI